MLAESVHIYSTDYALHALDNCREITLEKIMLQTTRYWINGNDVAEKEATIPVMDHGLLYGDGVFEGIRFYQRHPFRLSAHLQRLDDSARALQLRQPYTRQVLSEVINKMAQSFPVENGYLRLIITRGNGSMGLDPAKCQRANVIIIASQLELIDPHKAAEGISVIIANTRRTGADGLDPRIKSLNYLNNILARIEASHAGVEEAILLNQQGKVAEASAENIFIVKDTELLTPRLSDGALAGITRAIILQLAQDAGITAKEISLTVFDLYTADECFLCGTGSELVPVKDIDGRKLSFCPGPVFKQLNTAFKVLLSEECQS